MTPDSIEVIIGRRALTIPVIEDEETTLRIVERLNDRLRAIEESSPRVDTQRFAIEAALSFAADMDDISRERAEETRNTLKSLDRLSAIVRELLEIVHDSE